MAERRSLGLDRRASTRLSMQQQDDDDYDLDAMGISDGFRPSNTMTGHNRRPSQTSHHSTLLPGRRPTPPPRPSSATKPKALESFALRPDGATGHVAGRNSTVGSTSNAGPTRSSSVSTDMAYMRFESPYQGPSGPSHPYQMYPQESRLARTASMATTSTVPATERSYNGPNGPTHPYGMYPQNIVPEADTADEATPMQPVPVGFPGLNNNYSRRLGTDGEEIADIIGPDGHTEQLPPYSQYPDEAFARKTRPTVQVPMAGAGGIGLATRNPEFESQEDLNSPYSRQSTRSVMSDIGNHQAAVADAGSSEKKPELKSWQKFARRKACGIIPYWAIFLAACVLILFAVIMGSVLAALKPKHPPKHSHGENPEAEHQTIIYATLTTTFDANPFTTPPPGLPTLPTGTYALPISAPSTVQNGCLMDTEQSKAWSCQIPWSPLLVQVSGLPGATNPLAKNEVIIDYGNGSMQDCYPYGTQPPVLDHPQVLNLVSDNQEPDRGPAWFFQTTYNKVVVVQEDQLSSPYQTGSKRDVSPRDQDPRPGDFMRKGVAQPGDKPWFCYWNGTLLEAFLYVNLTSSEASQSPSITTPLPNPTQTSQPSAASSGVSSLDYSWPVGPPLPAYPKVLKIQERRIPRGPQAIPPYCIQNYITPDGTAQPVMNSTNQPATIYLNETDLETVAPMTGRGIVLDLNELELDQRDVEIKERQTQGNCGCVWLAT